MVAGRNINCFLLLQTVINGTVGLESNRSSLRQRDGGLNRVVGRGSFRNLGRESNSESQDSRIVGGKDARKGYFPHQVAVLSDGKYGICGASLVWYDIVVCAAHCTSMADYVAIGRYVNISPPDPSRNPEEEIIKICQKVVHPMYMKSPGNSNDITIFKLCSPSQKATPDDFVVLNSDPNLPKDNDALVVTGWGALAEGGPSATNLQEVEVYYIPNTECKSMYGESAITDDMLCAGLDSGGKDACQGDSGGPIVVQKGDGDPNENILVGVVSWGAGCAKPGFPGVYARVSTFVDWINDFAKTNSAKKPVQLKLSSSYQTSTAVAQSPATAYTDPQVSNSGTGLGSGGTTQGSYYSGGGSGSTTQGSYYSGGGSGSNTQGSYYSGGEMTTGSATGGGSSQNYYTSEGGNEDVAGGTSHANYYTYGESGGTDQSNTSEASAPTIGCCWSIDSSGQGVCAQDVRCNSDSAACMQMSMCGYTSKKYYKPGETFPTGPQNTSGSTTTMTTSSGATESTTSTIPVQSNMSTNQAMPGQCCWIVKLNRCLNQLDENPPCTYDAQTCQTLCNGLFYENIYAVGTKMMVPPDTVNGNVADIIVTRGQNYTTLNGFTYTATFDYTGLGVCQDLETNFPDRNGDPRDCAWSIVNYALARCRSYGALCPFSCGWCTP